MGISNMIRGFANGENISYLKDGVLHKGALMHLMVGSEADLANLPEDIMPGSVAYTAGYASVWQKTADSTWEPSSAGVNLAGIDPGKEVAYVKNGVLLKGTMEKIMVDDQSDLASLPEGIGPGSIAFTAGYASAWQKAANDTWGEVTQEKGGGGGEMVLTVTKTEGTTNDLYTLSKTWSEIKAALESGINVVMYGEGTGSYAGCYYKFVVTGVMSGNGIYGVSDFTYAYPAGPLGYCEVVFGEDAQAQLFMTSSADAYPSVYVTK